MLKNKNILITGGTGSFGKAFLAKLLTLDTNEIRIFSRDEKKQDDLRKITNNTKVKFYIGDVRDYESVCNAVRGVSYIFHAAALKQVPSCEFFPMEAVKTNIIGTDNVLKAAIEYKVRSTILLSTDKAVSPINAMGMSKALMEKNMISKSRNLNPDQTFCATRYGNVMGSRGSVIPLFINQIKLNKPLTITEPKMTRFMMTLEESVDLVMLAFRNGVSGDIYVQKAPSATIDTLAKALIELYNSKTEIVILGKRHGEKLFETLVSNEEKIRSVEIGDYYRIPSDMRDLNYDLYFNDGEEKAFEIEEYNSHNTKILSIEEMKTKLLEIDFIRNDISKTLD
jgi:UDP-N-acetylglucosamine 4,6-dehydratase/5-epimerase